MTWFLHCLRGFKKYQMGQKPLPQNLGFGHLQHLIKLSSLIHQDEGLDVISEGLGTLKNLAEDMNEELDRQVPLIDEIDTKVDKVTSDIKNNNVRFMENLYKMRLRRNFCIDIVLLCIIMGIALYLYKYLYTCKY